MIETKHDVLIVGGGIIGLACAHALINSGRQVTVIERGGIAGAASHGNCGTLTPSHAAPLPMPGQPMRALRWMLQGDAPLYIKPRWDPALWAWLLASLRRCNRDDFERGAVVKAALLLASRQRIQDWIEAEAMDCGFEPRGTLYVFRDRQALARARWHEDILARVGVEVERKNAAELALLEPALNDSVVGAFFHPQDAHLRPDHFAAELARVVRAGGGVIHEQSEVDGFVCAGDAVTGVRIGGEPVGAEAIVLAAGTWSPTLARELRLRLPIQPGKGYSITYSRPPLAPSIPLVLDERSVCVTAWADGFRLGSTMEFSGFDDSLNRLRLDALRRAAAEYLRQPEGPQLQQEWYGWRPMTPDDLPIIGPVKRRPGLWLATGHGMLGVTLSAITGEIIAAQLTGRAPPVKAEALAPERFG